MKKQNVVIKISGACLKTNENSVIDFNKLKTLASQIKTINQHRVSIILGGGNIERGCNAKV